MVAGTTQEGIGSRHGDSRISKVCALEGSERGGGEGEDTERDGLVEEGG